MDPTTNGFLRLEQMIAAAANSELILTSVLGTDIDFCNNNYTIISTSAIPFPGNEPIVFR